MRLLSKKQLYWRSARAVDTVSSVKLIRTAAFCALFLFAALAAPAVPVPAPVPAGRTWQLFVDDHVVESSRGLTRVIHRPQPHPQNPVFVGTEPWEKWFVEVNGRPVLYDEQMRQFRMYYLAPLHDPTAAFKVRYKACYAVSSDGVEWKRVFLNQVEWDGSPRNNILKWGENWMRRPNVMFDPRDPDPSRRYKMTYVDVLGGKTALCKAYSADGIHWRLNADGKPWFRDMHNSNLLGWDPRVSKYVLYPRMPGTPNSANRPRAAIGRATSTDFETWSEPELVIQAGPDDGDVDFSGLAATLYRDVYVGLLWVFGKDSVADAELAFSRDGIQWQRIRGDGYFFPRGGAGSWDSSGVLPVAPVVRGDKIYFFYSGWNLPYAAAANQRAQQGWIEGGTRKQRAIGLATLRLDGFASYQAKQEPGTLTTKLLETSGGMLFVNAAVRGEMRVEALDHNGNPLPGYSARDCRPLRGDSVRQAVRWRNKGRLTGPVTLRFLMRDADLYAFAIE